jgi:WD40 repeat protein/ABC-type phosphate/phosphonate transport system ATPase subunit
METGAVLETATSVKSPFQLFSAFLEQDRYKFFGRDEETRKLYDLVQETNIVVVYGESGTGKTSLVQCGLINETKHFNWTSITVRRIDDITTTLKQQLKKHMDQQYLDEEDMGVAKLMKEVFLNSFQPILLIFDQFEELFVSGTEPERKIFIESIKEILGMRIPWKIIFVIREEFIARMEPFDKEMPGFCSKKLRIELMSKTNCREVITRSCKLFNVELVPMRSKDSPGPDAADSIIDIVSDSENLIHLPYMQVFLDKLWKEAWLNDHDHIRIDQALVKKVGKMGDVLKGFLEEKVAAQDILTKIDAWKVLKLFVPEKGTTRKKINLSEYSAIPVIKLLDFISYFVEYKILTGCSENNYELAHESLVPIIQSIKLNEMRPRLSTPSIEGNPYKGLASFDQNDRNKFYGRKDAITAVYEKIKLQDLIVIAGNSGAGKSSLIKAGLFPELINEGYKILTIVRAGANPIGSLRASLAEANADTSCKKFILLIDQYEELITRINDRNVRENLYNSIFEVLEKQKNAASGSTIKFIITVRADFEPQFRIAQPLTEYWNAGKYIVPPFTREEIREVIEEPAYQAGLEFSPPSLVETITEEVYSSQATGLLPLMSFTLKELYDKYINSGREDNLLLEEDYNALGGVIGGLQNRAEQIYHKFKEEHPVNYSKYQEVMQNIILRMIYLSTGELAGQRVLEEDFIYNNDEINTIKKEVLQKLLASHLIVTGKDNKNNIYYEPAHDVLVRSWGQIWDWIGKVGRENLFLRSRLMQVVSDYMNSNKDQKLLWDNKWLDDLVPEIRNKNSWLNKKEFDFVGLSIQKREEAAYLVQLVEEDKTRQQKERDKYKEQLINEQRAKIKRTKGFVTLTVILLGIAVLMYLYANQKRSEVNDKMSLVNAANSKNESLNEDLQTKNKVLGSQKQELEKQKKALEDQKRVLEMQKDTMRNLVELEKEAKGLAIISASKEKVERLKAEHAEIVLKLLSDSLLKKAEEERIAKHETDLINVVLKNTNHRLDSIITDLTSQKLQNVTQLVSISRSFENTDIVRAFRIAELAYKKDSLNNEVAAQYRRLAGQQAYYYTKQFDGDFSTFSPDGRYILTVSSGQQLITLRQNGSFKVIDSLHAGPGLLSAVFSSSSRLVIMTYKNKVEISQAPNLRDVSSFKIAERADIVTSKFSPDETKILIVANDQLGWDDYPDGEQSLKPFFKRLKKDEKIVNAVFSEDSKRIISGSENGTINIWDAGNGKLIVQPAKKNIVKSYISPKGNCFIIATPGAIDLYNSVGKEIDIPDHLTDRYGQLNSATFSEDGRQVLLSFDAVASIFQQQKQQQKDDYNDSKTTIILLNVFTGKTRNLTDLIRQDDLSSFSGGFSDIVVDGNLLLTGLDHGIVKLMKLDNGVKEVLPGHSESIRAISVFNGGSYILTSANDNYTKVWQYNDPLSLDQLGILPKLSEEDLKKYGIKK